MIYIILKNNFCIFIFLFLFIYKFYSIKFNLIFIIQLNEKIKKNLYINKSFIKKINLKIK